MTVQEFATISAAIRAAWPQANIMPDDQSKDVWYTMLSDLDYRSCMAALKEHMSVSRFAPTIAELRERCSNITSAPIPDWSDAWENIMSVIRFYGMYREEEALQRLDTITRKCVKRLGFRNLCTSKDITADRANFRMIYEQERKAQKELRQLSPALQEQKRRVQQIGEPQTKELNMRERKSALNNRHIATQTHSTG